MAKTLDIQKEVEVAYIEDGEQITETIKVQKAGLGQWKKLTDTVKHIIEVLPDILEEFGIEDMQEQQAFLKNASPDDLIAVLPAALDLVAEEIINLIAIGADLDKEFVEDNVGFNEMTEFIIAIIEVNNLIEAGDNLNKLTRLFK